MHPAKPGFFPGTRHPAGAGNNPDKNELRKRGTVEVINLGEAEVGTDVVETNNLNLSDHWKLIRTAIERKKFTRNNSIE